MPFGFKVRKRYSDFEWLRAIIQTVYIGSVVSIINNQRILIIYE